jgi:geranylgeranyl transferase type-1 subunit beta
MELIDAEALQRFLLGKTQHFIGGFGKCSGDPPDLYHSYFALASLALLEHPGLKPIHSSACISLEAVQYLEQLTRKSS